MKEYKTVIGVGQTGSRLAALFANNKDYLITFNTDQRDIGGIKNDHNHLVTEGGAGQNYSRGLRIWAEKKGVLEKDLSPVVDQDVIYFIAGGGGSGSSSAITFLNILTKQANRILLVVVVPFIKESIPATSNATRLLSRTSEFSNNISVLIMANDEIAKEVGSTSFDKINNRIVTKIRSITDLIDYHDDNKYTPFALDDGDHKSVVYSGGFINISNDDLEEDLGSGPKTPKFSYGKLKEATNILIAKHVASKWNNTTADLEGDNLLKCAMTVGSRAKGARTLYGIIRTDKDLPKYTTIAAGLDIEKIFKKMKSKATDSALIYNEKIHTKKHKILENKEDRVLDI